MNKTYYGKTIDYSKRKIVDEELKGQVNDYRIILNQFKEEIDFWFSLLSTYSDSRKKYISSNLFVLNYMNLQFI